MLYATPYIITYRTNVYSVCTLLKIISRVTVNNWQFCGCLFSASNYIQHVTFLLNYIVFMLCLFLYSKLVTLWVFIFLVPQFSGRLFTVSSTVKKLIYCDVCQYFQQCLLCKWLGIMDLFKLSSMWFHTIGKSSNHNVAYFLP